MGLLNSFKEIIFAETDDRGKVSQISWINDTTGAATLHVPAAAYERYPKRAALRAVQIKVPHATKIHIIRHQYCLVRDPLVSYYLVRVEFHASKPIPNNNPE